MRRAILPLVLAAVVVIVMIVLVATRADPRPSLLSLPQGFQPEGITAGTGATFYAGSIPTGAIYRGDVRTGRGETLVAGRAERAAIGLDEADGLLFVAGGATGRAFVYDTETGREVASIPLAEAAPSFVNDVVVTTGAAYFTDSLNAVVYRLDRMTFVAEPVALSGDLVYAPGFNANGIEAAADGRTLLIVQTNTGRLFRADSRSGQTEAVDLAGESLPGGDGLVRSGRRLYVVQNVEDQIAVVELSGDLATGKVVERIADTRFKTPTTATLIDGRLYVVNARIDVADPSGPHVVAIEVPAGN